MSAEILTQHPVYCDELLKRIASVHQLPIEKLREKVVDGGCTAIGSLKATENTDGRSLAPSVYVTLSVQIVEGKAPVRFSMSFPCTDDEVNEVRFKSKPPAGSKVDAPGV